METEKRTFLPGVFWGGAENGLRPSRLLFACVYSFLVFFALFWILLQKEEN